MSYKLFKINNSKQNDNHVRTLVRRINHLTKQITLLLLLPQEVSHFDLSISKYNIFAIHSSANINSIATTDNNITHSLPMVISGYHGRNESFQLSSFGYAADYSIVPTPLSSMFQHCSMFNAHPPSHSPTNKIS